MKICLFLEFRHGAIFKKMGAGGFSAVLNQEAILKRLSIPFSEKWDPSCDIVQINSPWLMSYQLAKKVRQEGKKVAIWSHTTVEDTKQVFRFLPFLTPIFKKYLIRFYALADLIFSPTEYTKSLLIAYGLPAEKIVVQSNAVNLEKYYRSEVRRRAGRKKYGLAGVAVGTVASAMQRKGIDTFLLAAEKFPQNKFRWFGKTFGVGSGLLTKPLPKTLPKNACFTGYVDDTNTAFNSLDIFFFPSYEENEGMVLLEAAAVGLPLLVRDIPVYRGWLIHGENCLKAKNTAEFYKYLDLLLTDEALRTNLGKNATLLAQQKSIESVSKKTLFEYKKLMSGQYINNF